MDPSRIEIVTTSMSRIGFADVKSLLMLKSLSSCNFEFFILSLSFSFSRYSYPIYSTLKKSGSLARLSPPFNISYTTFFIINSIYSHLEKLFIRADHFSESKTGERARGLLSFPLFLLFPKPTTQAQDDIFFSSSHFF